LKLVVFLQFYTMSSYQSLADIASNKVEDPNLSAGTFLCLVDIIRASKLFPCFNQTLMAVKKFLIEMFSKQAYIYK